MIYLTTLFWVYGVSRKWVLPIAIDRDARHPLRVLQAACKVPLPWGLLQGSLVSAATLWARLQPCATLRRAEARPTCFGGERGGRQ